MITPRLLVLCAAVILMDLTAPTGWQNGWLAACAALIISDFVEVLLSRRRA